MGWRAGSPAGPQASGVAACPGYFGSQSCSGRSLVFPVLFYLSLVSTVVFSWCFRHVLPCRAAAAPSFCTEQSSPAKDKGHAISNLISTLAVVWEGFAGFAPKARVRCIAGCESLGLWGACWGTLDQWGLQAGGTAWKEQESQQQAPPVAFYSRVCQLHAAKAAV